MTAPSLTRPAASLVPIATVVAPVRIVPSRAPDAGAPPGATAVLPRPRIQGPVPIAVRPLGPPAPRHAAPAGPPFRPVAPHPTGRTDGLAVAALVTGFLVPPVGAVLGPLALRRIGRTGRRGRGLAVAGATVGGIVTLLGILVLVLGLLLGLASRASGDAGAPGPAGTAATTQCGGSTCTVTIDGAGTVDIVGAAGRESLTVLALADGSITVRHGGSPVVVPVGAALVLPAGNQIVLTAAAGGTATLAHAR